MPINSPSQRPLSFPPPGLDDEERVKLMRDIMQAKEELLRFRNEMDGLAKQIDGMEIDLVTIIYFLSLSLLLSSFLFVIIIMLT